MCVGCGSSVVCINFCTYVAYDGRRYCVECKRRPGASPYKSYYDELVNLFSDNLDEMQLCGQHFYRRKAPLLWSKSQCFRHGECKDVFRAWTMQVARKRMSEEAIVYGSLQSNVVLHSFDTLRNLIRTDLFLCTFEETYMNTCM